MEEFSLAGDREDERGLEQLREHHFFTVGMLNRSTGSAYLEIGSTKVAVAVQGPRPPDGKAQFTARGALNITVDICPFAGMPADKSKGLSPQSIRLAHHVRESLSSVVLLERYPKAVLDVHCCVMEHGGSTAAALISAAGLAIVDAGIHCRCMLSAACIVVVGKQMMVDPTNREEAAASTRVIIAMDATRQKVAHVDIDGALDAHQLRDAMGLGLAACGAVEPQLRNAVVQGRQV